MFNSKKTLSNIFILSIIIVTLLSSCTEKTHDDNISVNGSMIIPLLKLLTIFLVLYQKIVTLAALIASPTVAVNCQTRSILKLMLAFCWIMNMLTQNTVLL
ncbi:MAG TPA: hypothetical protein GX401_02350 [Clostridiales bacterium]|nr:hypothetical protein [Clostridiales bacterium]